MLLTVTWWEFDQTVSLLYICKKCNFCLKLLCKYAAWKCRFLSMLLYMMAVTLHLVICNVCSLSCELDTKCSDYQARSSRIKGVFLNSQLMKNIWHSVLLNCCDSCDTSFTLPYISCQDDRCYCLDENCKANSTVHNLLAIMIVF